MNHLHSDSAHTARSAGVQPELSLTMDAETALGLAEEIHAMIDQINSRLFRAAPFVGGITYSVEVGGGGGVGGLRQSNDPDPLSVVITHTRQRLESAASRLESILARL